MGHTYYYDADRLRSKDLTVGQGPVEYYDYDDDGTPDDESDDKYLYYLRWYALHSGRDASWGEIWLYNPDFERVGTWAVPMLSCVVHGWNDGLIANPNGEVHGVIIPVPVSVMEKAGTYRFVLHFYDDFADSYKNHQVKAALEVNAYVQSVYEVYPCICPDKVHYPDEGRNDCHCYANKLKCDDCPAFRNYCPARTSTGAGHPKCQCKNYRACQPRDCSLCHAIRSRLGNVYNSPGYVQARGYGQVEFYVRLIVRRVLPGSSSQNNLTILLKRPKPKTGGDIDDEETAKPWKFERNMPTCWSAAWKVTKLKGRWEMWVTGQKDVFKDFKIDKRAQIVITAKSWDRALRNGLLCNQLVGRVYNHLGIDINGQNVSSVWASTTENGAQDIAPGALVFYRSPTQGFNPPNSLNRVHWGDGQNEGNIASHVAIRIGKGMVIDCNCGALDPEDPDYNKYVDEHQEETPLKANPGEAKNPDPKLDIKDRTPPDLIKLDAE